MELSNRVIYIDDECCYGFLEDIITDFKYYANDCENEFEKELFEEGIEKAESLLNSVDDDACFGLYQVWKHPMGAYEFVRMIPATK